jgi:hypothetical protein
MSEQIAEEEASGFDRLAKAEAARLKGLAVDREAAEKRLEVLQGNLAAAVKRLEGAAAQLVVAQERRKATDAEAELILKNARAEAVAARVAGQRDADATRAAMHERLRPVAATLRAACEAALAALEGH